MRVKWVSELEAANRPIYEAMAKGEDLNPDNALVSLREGPDIFKAPREDQRESFIRDSIISTPDRDSHGDILRSEGVQLERFEKNPVVLYGHARRSLPIGKSLEVRASKERVEATDQYAVEEDETGFTRTVWNLIAGGFLNAKSVGLWPLKWEPIEEKHQGHTTVTGYDIKEWELREHSVVTVPSNAAALFKTAGLVLDLANDLEMTEEDGNPEQWPAEVAQILQVRKAATLLQEYPELVESPKFLDRLAAMVAERLQSVPTQDDRRKAADRLAMETAAEKLVQKAAEIRGLLD